MYFVRLNRIEVIKATFGRIFLRKEKTKHQITRWYILQNYVYMYRYIFYIKYIRKINIPPILQQYKFWAP